MIFEIKIQELRVANFTARVEADSEKEAVKLFNELNNKDYFEEEWMDASDYAETIESEMTIEEVKA